MKQTRSALLPLSYAAAEGKSLFKRRSTRWIVAAILVALLVPVGGFVYFNDKGRVSAWRKPNRLSTTQNAAASQP